jgi:hypothetical protein
MKPSKSLARNRREKLELEIAKEAARIENLTSRLQINFNSNRELHQSNYHVNDCPAVGRFESHTPPLKMAIIYSNDFPDDFEDCRVVTKGSLVKYLA